MLQTDQQSQLEVQPAMWVQLFLRPCSRAFQLTNERPCWETSSPTAAAAAAAAATGPAGIPASSGSLGIISTLWNPESTEKSTHKISRFSQVRLGRLWIAASPSYEYVTKT